jgi:Outer membrane protein beta-barrel domain
MVNFKVWMVAGCLFGLASGAGAQEAYLAAGGGLSDWKFGCGPNGCDRTSRSWRVAAGYRFNGFVAVEGFHFDFRSARSSQASLDGELGGKALGVQALLGGQLGALDLAGKIGLAEVRSNFRPASTSLDVAKTSRHTEVIGGAMAAYRLTPNISVRLDVDVVTVALDSYGIFYTRGADVTTVTLGMMYRF